MRRDRIFANSHAGRNRSARSRPFSGDFSLVEADLAYFVPNMDTILRSSDSKF